jgi:hypothetical protein
VFCISVNIVRPAAAAAAASPASVAAATAALAAAAASVATLAGATLYNNAYLHPMTLHLTLLVVMLLML